MKKIITIVVCSLALILCSASAFAQADTLKVDYFANAHTAGAPDGTVRLDNPGTNPSATGNICADIFVFDSNQEMSECCSCLLTPDGLRTLSVNTDITGNPLTGVTLTTGAIKVVSSRPSKTGSCPFPTYLNPAPGVRSWVTHIQDSNFAVTETGSQDATLSSTEIAGLAKQCSDIKIVGSGKGVCTCGTGD